MIIRSQSSVTVIGSGCLASGDQNVSISFFDCLFRSHFDEP